MKLTFLRYNTSIHLKKNKTLRSSTAFNKSASVGILFSVEDRDKHEAIKEFARKMEAEGKSVKVLCFLPEKKENFEFLYNYFTAKDVSFWGNPVSNDAIAFTNTSFDYIYCFDENPNPMLLNLLARSKAKCRIGRFAEGNEKFFEMMIQSKGVRKLIDESLRYTKELR